MPEDIPPADLARQWLAWYALGGSGLRFPVRWVLGVVNEDRWAEVDPHTGTGTLLDGMPQPEGWSNSTLTPLPTTHTVPSCGWMIQQHAKAGKFDRQRADDLGLPTKERAMLARGEDVTRLLSYQKDPLPSSASWLSPPFRWRFPQSGLPDRQRSFFAPFRAEFLAMEPRIWPVLAWQRAKTTSRHQRNREPAHRG